MAEELKSNRRRSFFDLAILTLGQGLSGTVIAILTTVSSLVGATLAPKHLATLPITATVTGAAVMVYFVSSLMAVLGRRRAFLVGSAIGAAGGFIAAAGIYFNDFFTFVTGTFVLGLFAAFNPYYRFAAADASPTPAFRTRAISYVVAGGILGGFVGPFLASTTVNTVPLAPFIGTFFALVGVCLVLAIAQALLSPDRSSPTSTASVVAARSKRDLLRSPDFVVATFNCATGFGVMTLLMNATPLAMVGHGFTIGHTATVLQAHFVAMYAPSLISGHLMAKLGVRPVVVIGAVFSIAGVITAIAGETYVNFWVSLVCFGIGWSFMFNGGTALLTKTYSEAEKQKAQGLNSLIVYVTNAFASLGSGLLLATQGWIMINLIAIPFLIASILLTVWNSRSVTISESS